MLNPTYQAQAGSEVRFGCVSLSWPYPFHTTSNSGMGFVFRHGIFGY